MTNALTITTSNEHTTFTSVERDQPPTRSTPHYVFTVPIHTAVDPDRPWLIPVVLGWVVYDGVDGYLLEPRQIGAFIKRRPQAILFFHDAVSALKPLSKLMREVDPYTLVENHQVIDTHLMWRLLSLATTGDAGSQKLESIETEYLRVHGRQAESASTRSQQTQVGLSPLTRLHDISHAVLRAYCDNAVRLSSIASQLGYSQYGRRGTASYYRPTPSPIPRFGQLGFHEGTIVSEKWGVLTHDIQLRAAIVCDQITALGLNIDCETARKKMKQLEDGQKPLGATLLKWGYTAGRSNEAKLQRILTGIYHDLGIQAPERHEDGQLDTSTDALHAISSHEFVDALTRYRQNSAIIANFGSKLGAANSKLHPQFDILKVTGRTSAFGDLSAQNLPRNGGIRECIVPSPGHVLVSADYATIELVALAYALEHQFRFPSPLAAAIRQGRDIHTMVAAAITGKPEYAVTADERKAAKVINFGVPAGMEAPALQQHAVRAYGLQVSLEEMDRFRQQYLITFPDIAAFLRHDESDTNQLLALAHKLDLDSNAHRRATDANATEPIPGCWTKDRTAWIAGMALKVYGQLKPKTSTGRDYFQSELDYFWTALLPHIPSLPAKLQNDARRRKPSRALQQAVAGLVSAGGVMTATGRVRNKAGYTAKRNTIFQGLAADGAKFAMWKLWRRGFRIVNFVHDEFLIEVSDDSNVAAKCGEIEWLMQQGMGEVLPGLPVRINTKVMRRWESDDCERASINQPISDAAA